MARVSSYIALVHSFWFPSVTEGQISVVYEAVVSANVTQRTDFKTCLGSELIYKYVLLFHFNGEVIGKNRLKTICLQFAVKFIKQPLPASKSFHYCIFIRLLNAIICEIFFM